MTETITHIPISRIREPFHVMRFVNRESIEFWELKDSIRKHGFFNSLAVRPCASHSGLYELVDGVHRYTAAKELGLDSVPCIIKSDVDDDELLIAQLQANAIRPPTSRIEYAHQIRRIMARNPDMSFVELGALIGKSPLWIKDTLGLLDLLPELQDEVDRGDIRAGNAVMLAKLPRHLRADFVKPARELRAKDFQQVVSDALRRHGAASKRGTLRTRFTRHEPRAYLRSLEEIAREIDLREVGFKVIEAEECGTLEDAFYAGVKWCIHHDHHSVEAERKRILDFKNRYFRKE